MKIGISAIALLSQILVLVFTKENFDTTKLYIGVAIINIIALIGAVIYIAFGFKKSSAVYYKGFVHLFLLSIMFRIIELSKLNHTIHSTLLCIISFGLVCLLAYAKDLGEKQSMIFAYLTLAISVILYAVGIIAPLVAIKEPAAVISSNMLLNFGHLTVSSILVGLVQMKYVDKKSRNTK